MPRKKSPPLPPKEPWWGKTQKITAAVLGICALIGVIWSSVSKADARYAKERSVQEIKQDLAMLGKAFQYDQFDRAIGTKNDMIIKIELRLNEKIGDAERARLHEMKRKLELEIEELRNKQRKIETQQTN